ERDRQTPTTEDSERTRDSDGYQSDSETDSAGDSARYRSETKAPPESDETLPDSIVAVYKRMREGWWNKAGFETFYDYVKHEDAKWEAMGWSRRSRPKTRDLPNSAPPDIDLEELAKDATRKGRPLPCQVNVRLSELGYNALSEAAERYGLSPST